jgi:nucleoside-diphosphate-sugar epimerase
VSLLCILGASGFVGNRTLERARREGRRIRALAHRRPLAAHGVDVVQGDAGDAAVLDRLLEPQAVVLNFAYGGEASGEALAAALSQACGRRGVRRLVHVSTCSVYGGAAGEVVNEETPCAPVTPYERAKHQIEAILERGAGRYELAVLRPTAVFGPGGRNLETLALRVRQQRWPLRYLRACAMGRRRMHVVDVDYVAAAVLFLGTAPLERPAERFIVSQDDEPLNDYASLEAYFVVRFGARPYPFAPLTPPAPTLRFALRLAGRNDVEPNRRYSARRLLSHGFRSPRAFAAALEEYAAWIEQQRARP